MQGINSLKIIPKFQEHVSLFPKLKEMLSSLSYTFLQLLNKNSIVFKDYYIFVNKKIHV